MRYYVVLVSLLFSSVVLADPPQCTGLPMNSPEFEACEAAWRVKIQADRDARAQAIADRETTRQAVASDPRTPSILATAAYWAFLELRKTALAELREQKHYAAIGSLNKPLVWTLQERLRYADRGVRKYKKLAKVSKDEPLVLTLRACFVQWPDVDTGPCAEESVSVYTSETSPMDLN